MVKMVQKRTKQQPLKMKDQSLKSPQTVSRKGHKTIHQVILKIQLTNQLMPREAANMPTSQQQMHASRSNKATTPSTTKVTQTTA